MHEFDEDTRIEDVGPGRYRGHISARWDIGPIPNGGYVLAVAMSALRRAMPGKDPLTITAHYLRRADHGPSEIEVDVHKKGRSTMTASVKMVQAGQPHLVGVATYGELSASGGPAFVDAAPPEVPAESAPAHESAFLAAPEITRRFDIRFAPETIPWATGGRGQRAELRGRIRFADGRPPDVHALGLFADAMPPPAFSVLTPGWVPTVELTVHVRARPSPGWLRCRFSTRFAFGGYLEEDGEIWDERGTLVALSRQLALLPRAG